MDSEHYHLPKGLYQISGDNLDLRPDTEIDRDLNTARPVTNEKNLWFFWHSGFDHMYPYLQRNIRAWHRRFSKCGWTIRVLNRLQGSPLNIAHFLDVSDPETFPKAFINATIGGDYAPQHTSDLVRWPLLLKYGGVYADVGLIQIGDLDRLWNATIGDPQSGYEVFSYNNNADGRNLTNYFLASGKGNPLWSQCHRLFLHLWNEEGGKSSTEGMHANPLLEGIPLMGEGFVEKGRKELTDYIIQGQVTTMVMGLVDTEGGWDGPKYVREHVYGLEFMAGSQLINEYTAWDGQRAFDCMSLPIAKDGEHESEDQKLARKIVEGCLQRSFGFKLAHGIILKMIGETLGSLWRKHEGSDNIPGTYAHWLRHGTIYWNQEEIPPPLDFKVTPPFKIGQMLEA